MKHSKEEPASQYGNRSTHGKQFEGYFLFLISSLPFVMAPATVFTVRLLFTLSQYETVS
jgi:hypothetical protein